MTYEFMRAAALGIGGGLVLCLFLALINIAFASFSVEGDPMEDEDDEG